MLLSLWKAFLIYTHFNHLFMKRKIITINEQLCNGCGKCVKGCHEGALQMIDNKARIISELYCDGLGACIGDCPVGAISIEEREALPYDEDAVMQKISQQGPKTIIAHLKHLKDHGEKDLLEQGLAFLEKHGIDIDTSFLAATPQKQSTGCPGSTSRSFTAPPTPTNSFSGIQPNLAPSSELTHWPIQLHLLNPQAPFFKEADVVLAADCVAFSYPDFHAHFLKGKKLAIACPKLDSNKEVYIEKIATMINSGEIQSLTVVIMEVPCCGGLLQLVRKALENTERKIDISCVIVGIKGNIKGRTFIQY